MAETLLAFFIFIKALNIALRRFLHNHGNTATEGSPTLIECPLL